MHGTVTLTSGGPGVGPENYAAIERHGHDRRLEIARNNNISEIKSPVRARRTTVRESQQRVATRTPEDISPSLKP
jgi:hypothetical protein